MDNVLTPSVGVLAADDYEKSGVRDAKQALSVIPGLDVGDGLRRIGRKQEAYERSLRLLVRRAPEMLSVLDGDLANARLEDFAIGVHGLKGSLASLGENICSELAKGLELAARAGDFTRCSEDFQEFRARVEEFIESLASALPANDCSVQGDRDLLQKSLTDVIIYLEKFNRVPALNTLKDILRYSFGKDIDMKLVELNAAVEAYDFGLGIEISRGMVLNGR